VLLTLAPVHRPCCSAPCLTTHVATFSEDSREPLHSLPHKTHFTQFNLFQCTSFLSTPLGLCTLHGNPLSRLFPRCTQHPTMTPPYYPFPSPPPPIPPSPSHIIHDLFSTRVNPNLIKTHPSPLFLTGVPAFFNDVFPHAVKHTAFATLHHTQLASIWRSFLFTLPTHHASPPQPPPAPSRGPCSKGKPLQQRGTTLCVGAPGGVVSGAALTLAACDSPAAVPLALALTVDGQLRDNHTGLCVDITYCSDAICPGSYLEL